MGVRAGEVDSIEFDGGKSSSAVIPISSSPKSSKIWPE